MPSSWACGLSALPYWSRMCAFGRTFCRRLATADVALRRVEGGLGRRADDLGAERLEHHLLLAAHLLGHRDDHPVAADRGGHREADAGVAAGRLDQRVARLDAPRLLGLEQHAHADAVLHRAAGVHELELAEQLAGQVAPDAREPDHGRVPDRVEHRVVDGLVTHSSILPAAVGDALLRGLFPAGNRKEKPGP